MAGGKSNCSSQSCQNDEAKKSTKSEPKKYTFYFDIFFDGTGNNAYNTDTRIAADKAMKKIFNAKASEDYDKAFHAGDTNKGLVESAVWLAKHTQNLDSEEKDAIIEYGEKTDFATSSYENYYTNVYQLYMFFKKRKDTYAQKIYLEGIGTASIKGKGAKDETLGGAFGAGDTGIKGKAQKARGQVIDYIESINDIKTGDSIDIEFTVYGFSRGAAAARHFIHIIINGFNDLENFDYTLKLKSKLAKKNIQDIKFTFVGLFDTVSAYNTDGTIGERSNVQTLGLDSLKLGEVKKIYHIVAKDEHRKNFGLTNIDSGKGKGKEIILPGVHSDIGGSYHNNIVEELVVYNVDVLYMSAQDKTDAENDIERLIKQGWFDRTDVYKDKSKKIFLTENEPIRNALTGWNEIKVRRSRIGGISNKYARIPFTLMYQDCGFDKFETDNIEENKDVSLHKEALNDDFILNVFNNIKSNPEIYNNIKIDDESYKLFKARRECQSCDLKEELYFLRRKYFHFSAHYNGEIMGMIAPYGPRFENTLRKRKIHPG